jgi:hypothetical protein
MQIIPSVIYRRWKYELAGEWREDPTFEAINHHLLSFLKAQDTKEISPLYRWELSVNK